MSFFYGFADEIVKLAENDTADKVLKWVGRNPGTAKVIAGPAAEGAARGVVKETVDKAGPSALGAATGGLAGKAIFRRGALGALAGLGYVHRKKLLAAAKGAKDSAEEALSRRKK
ncbi:MAG: hypothetical protein ACYTBJ_05360 [Planctomycetota bacterium]|jgi:hypothetical protein